jgi:hypothetical protein
MQNLFNCLVTKYLDSIGEVAERLKAAVLKTVNPQGFQSSNLCLSAILLYAITLKPEGEGYRKKGKNGGKYL